MDTLGKFVNDDIMERKTKGAFAYQNCVFTEINLHKETSSDSMREIEEDFGSPEVCSGDYYGVRPRSVPELICGRRWIHR